MSESLVRRLHAKPLSELWSRIR